MIKRLSTCIAIALSLSQPLGSALASPVEDQALLIAELQRQLTALQNEVGELREQVDSFGNVSAPQTPLATQPLPEPTAVSSHSELRFNGDLRVRYENTSAHAGARSRNRGVIRGRLGAAYAVDDSTTLGARITTGDPDDPNSTDVTMGNFNDDLDVSLDQLYVRFQSRNGVAALGKFTNPFARTDLVWDSDVNPYGAAAQFEFFDTGSTAASATVIYALIDEQTVLRDSTMAGMQMSLHTNRANDWSLGLHGAYYDYSIGSLANAGSGDTRGNNVTPDGNHFVSDFRLLNFTGTFLHENLIPNWPLKVTADIVRNLGARVPEDTGYSLDFEMGQSVQTGDLLFRYGFAVAETDAVFAAFSHDNTSYSTNYRQHTLEFGYRARENLAMYLTAYHYKRNDFDLTGQPGINDWVSRIRMNLHYHF